MRMLLQRCSCKMMMSRRLRLWVPALHKATMTSMLRKMLLLLQPRRLLRRRPLRAPRR